VAWMGGGGSSGGAGGGEAGRRVSAAPGAAASRGRAATAGSATTIADIATAVLALALAWMFVRPPVGGREGEPRRADAVRTLALAMFVLFIVQGALTARGHVGRAETLSGGGDWLALEARGREVAIHGLSMSFGYPWGKGETFAYYPGYSYFLAAVHKTGGEDLFAPVFVQFVLLFATNLLVYATARRLFGQGN